jgi:hypothetical protein
VPEKIDANLNVSSRTCTIAAGDIGFIPLLDLYRDPATGLASFTYDGVTSVLAAVIRAS